MKDLVNKVFEEKMNNGDFEKIVAEEFDKCVRSACNNLFGYGGDIKKQMEEKLKSVMGNIIERSDFGSYVEKIEYIINEATRGSRLEDYKDTLNNLKTLIGNNDLKDISNIKLSEMFEKYQKLTGDYIENNSYSDYDDEPEVEEGRVSVVFRYSLEVEEEDGYFSGKTKNIIFRTYNDSLDEEIEDLTIGIKLSEWRSGFKLYNPMISAKDFRHMSEFEIYLLGVYNSLINIEVDIMDKNVYDTIEWDYEYS